MAASLQLCLISSPFHPFSSSSSFFAPYNYKPISMSINGNNYLIASPLSFSSNSPLTKSSSYHKLKHSLNSSPLMRLSRSSNDQQIVFTTNHAHNSASVAEDHQMAEQLEKPLKIGIVGFGNFGQFIARALKRQGHLILATSRSDYSDYCQQHGIEFFRNTEGLCEEQPDVVLLCSSILSTESLVRSIPMEKLKPDTIFADVLSVKQFPRNLFLEVLPPGFGILCTHPMFGPESGKHGWDGLPFVFHKVRVSENQTSQQHINCAKFLSIFQNEGCRMVEMSCEEHDRYAAGSQFITHTIGRILSHLNLKSTPIDTKGYETLLQLTENTVSDSFDLYYGLFMYNVNATQQIENLDRAFETVKQKLFGRLHDILRKQIVERVPLQEGPLMMRKEADHTLYNFLPDSENVKDLSSFALPPAQELNSAPASQPREPQASV